MANKSNNQSFNINPTEWLVDEKLNLCSLAAQGLWVKILCYLWRSETPGLLLYNEKPMTHAHLAKLTHTEATIVKDLINELTTNGVVSYTAEGTIINQDIYNQHIISTKRAIAGRRGMDKRWQKEENQDKNLLSFCYNKTDNKTITKDNKTNFAMPFVITKSEEGNKPLELPKENDTPKPDNKNTFVIPFVITKSTTKLKESFIKESNNLSTNMKVIVKERESEREKKEEETETESTQILSPNKQEKIKYTEDDLKLATLLQTTILINYPKMKITETQLPSWSNTIRLMREMDNHTTEDIKQTIEWTTRNDFWHSVILSADNLRKHWNKLQAQIQKEKKVLSSTKGGKYNDKIYSQRQYIPKEIPNY